jgi:hypothetical protein
VILFPTFLASGSRTQGFQMDCFQTKNPNLGKFLEGLGMENVVTYIYDHLEYLWPFGITYGSLV